MTSASDNNGQFMPAWQRGRIVVYQSGARP